MINSKWPASQKGDIAWTQFMRTGDVLELHVGLGPLNVSVLACQFRALLSHSHFLTVYHLVTVVDSCCTTRSHVFLLFFCISFLGTGLLLISTMHGNTNIKRT